MKLLGYDLPKLKKDENGNIYLPNVREDFDKFQYKIGSSLTLYDEILWLIGKIMQKEPEPFYITKIEAPALAHLIKYGFYKSGGEEISRTKARQLSRFIKRLFVSLFDVYIYQKMEQSRFDQQLEHQIERLSLSLEEAERFKERAYRRAGIDR